MRPQQNRRVRGRNNNNNNGNNNNRRGPNPLSRNYESNGPDVKIRGNAQQIADKYISLARDAQGAGDRVMSENYLQHAEHYLRIILAAVGQMPQFVKRDENNDQDCDETNAEGTKKDDINYDKSTLSTQQQKNDDCQKTKVHNGHAGDELAVNGLSKEDVNQQQCLSKENTETVKKSRRTSRRSVVRSKEEISPELSQVMPEVSNSDGISIEDISTENTTSSDLLGEGAQKKSRRRRVLASPVSTPPVEGSV
ncbi:DUF4167 domain-containing protein [Bartonella sp. B10]